MQKWISERQQRIEKLQEQQHQHRALYTAAQEETK